MRHLKGRTGERLEGEENILEKLRLAKSHTLVTQERLYSLYEGRDSPWRE